MVDESGVFSVPGLIFSASFLPARLYRNACGPFFCLFFLHLDGTFFFSLHCIFFYLSLPGCRNYAKALETGLASGGVQTLTEMWEQPHHRGNRANLLSEL